MEDIKAILHYTQDYTEFKIQDVVYLKTDPEQLERIVYSITIYPTHVIYSLVQGANTSCSTTYSCFIYLSSRQIRSTSSPSHSRTVTRSTFPLSCRRMNVP